MEDLLIILAILVCVVALIFILKKLPFLFLRQKGQMISNDVFNNIEREGLLNQKEIFKDHSGEVNIKVSSNNPITEADIDRIKDRIEELKNAPESANVKKKTFTYKSDKPLSKEEIDKLKEEFMGDSFKDSDFKYTYTENRPMTEEELNQRTSKI